MRVVIAPPVPALLPRYAGLLDPVAELRAACWAAAGWLTEDEGAAVVAGDALGLRVGRELLGGRDGGPGLLVMANGSARRSERAPGHLDERAAGFDATVEAALATGDAAALAGIDLELAGELLTAGMPLLRDLAGLSVLSAHLDHAADPYGVRYWVVRWQCAT